jgi:glycosidase
VVLDGVFNHVGRNFWAFEDVKTNMEKSRYTSWFYINFSGNSSFYDGFWYEGWEGHYELVKLNLNNPDVVDHIKKAVGMWIDEFNIDGLRLDVAYSLPLDFLNELCRFCRGKNADFWMVGEALHGDYRRLMDGNLLNSVTNYECYKGLYSSFNEENMFEIAYSLNRQFGDESWTLYKGRHLFNFVDNHDVTRIATILKNSNHLPLIYALLFTMPGIPCIYYGSEWGITGSKTDGDITLRPQIEMMIWNELTSFISKLSEIHKNNDCLINGNYKQIYVAKNQLIFERKSAKERIIVAINSSFEEHGVHFNANSKFGTELISGEKIDLAGGLHQPPYSVMIILTE